MDRADLRCAGHVVFRRRVQLTEMQADAAAFSVYLGLMVTGHSAARRGLRRLWRREGESWCRGRRSVRFTLGRLPKFREEMSHG